MSAPQNPPVSSAAPVPPWPNAKFDGTARLEINGRTTEFPVVVGTEGEQGIDSAKLRSATGNTSVAPAANSSSTRAKRMRPR